MARGKSKKGLDLSPKPNIKKGSVPSIDVAREGKVVPEPGRILETFYKHAQWGTNDDVWLPHRNAYYVWVAIKDAPEIVDKLGRVPTLREVEDAMYWEGMLTAAEYGIPAWFRKKYGFR